MLPAKSQLLLIKNEPPDFRGQFFYLSFVSPPVGERSRTTRSYLLGLLQRCDRLRVSAMLMKPEL
jgi:hypothetical protein